MVPLANRPLIGYLFDVARDHGCSEVVLAIGYAPDSIREAYGAGEELGVRITYEHERELRGTAGAIKNCERHLDETFAVMNGDQVMGLDLTAMVEAHRARGALVTIALRQVQDASSYGKVECDETGRVLAFREKEPGAGSINAGAYVMEPEVLGQIPAGRPHSSEYDLFPALIAAGAPVYGFLQPGDWPWFDVGTPERYLECQRALLDGDTGLALPARATLGGPTTAPPVLVDATAHVAPEARLGPYAAIGAGCRIGAGAVVENSAIWEGTTIESGADVRGAIIGANSHIGSGVSVGPGSVLADQTTLTSTTREGTNAD